MNMGWTLIRIALLYMLVGLVMGLIMAMSHDWTLVSVHSHMLLLGWVTMAIAGVVYILEPRCANRKLARVHFWGHNIGLPIMMVSLGFLHYGHSAIEPLVGVGSVIVLVSLVVFVVNVYSVRRPKSSPIQTEESPV